MGTNIYSRSFNIENLVTYFDFSSCNSLFKSVFHEDKFICKTQQREYDFSMLFKMLVLQRYFDVGTEELYFAISDRKSWMSFLNISDFDELPHSSSFENLRWDLIRNNILYDIFDQLDRTILDQGIVIHRGCMKELIAHPIGDLDYASLNAIAPRERISEIYYPEILYPIKFRSDTSDMKTFQEIFWYKIYDFDIGFTPQFILDCGANIGLASIFFKNQFPDTFIVAVEPENSNYRLLEHNLSYYYPTVECLERGIWSKNTTLSIKNPNSDKWEFIVGESDGSGKESFKSVTITDILKKYEREKIDILKIDIEGSELELFSDNYEYWLPKTQVIMIELHDHIRNGCSESFFSALSNYRFVLHSRGNTIIGIQPPPIDIY